MTVTNRLPSYSDNTIRKMALVACFITRVIPYIYASTVALGPSDKDKYEFLSELFKQTVDDIKNLVLKEIKES